MTLYKRFGALLKQHRDSSERLSSVICLNVLILRECVLCEVLVDQCNEYIINHSNTCRAPALLSCVPMLSLYCMCVSVCSVLLCVLHSKITHYFSPHRQCSHNLNTKNVLHNEVIVYYKARDMQII